MVQRSPTMISKRGAQGAFVLKILFGLSSCTGAKGPARSPEKTQEIGEELPERTAMDPAKLSYALRGQEDSFRKCLMRAIDRRGKVTLRFGVDSAGAVNDTQVSHSTIAHAAVEQCLMTELSSVKFGPQATATENSFTFVFRLTEPLNENTRKRLLKQADKEAPDAIKLLPASRGTMDLDHIAEIVQARYPLYAHCYRDSILRRGESRGVVRFRLHIDSTGKVAELEDAGSVLPDPFAVDCMAEAFYLMEFEPPTDGPVVLRYSMGLE
jgi:hypothetical protein